jgi:hypothetical protein
MNITGMINTKIVVGLIVIVLAALVLADSVLGYVAQESIFDLQGFQLIVGFVLVVLAGSYFEESKK